jgi:probable phosphoglycerate mutase
VRLLLVRHGESICSVNGIVGGELGCTGLTERGHAQARALGERLARERLRVDALVASTLPRAHQTAEAIAAALDLEISSDEDLRELIPGEIDGTPWADFAGFDVIAEPDRVISPGGESLNVFHARVHGVLDRLAEAYDGKTVVAACHGGVVGVAFVGLLGIPVDNQTSIDVQFTSITEWRRDADRWHLVRLNDYAHLMGSDLLAQV